MRAFRAAEILALLALAGGVALGADVASEKNRPVTKVINMLKDMTSQLEKEGEEDKEVYEQMGCWCETNDKEKTKSIADAEARIQSLQAAIEEFTASSSQLNAEIKTLDSEIAKNTEALASAKALRTKQLAEFNAEEKDAIASIGSLKSAVVALEKHNSASLLQTDVADSANAASFVGAMKTVQYILHRHREFFRGVVSSRHVRLIDSLAGSRSFLQGGPAAFAQARTHGDAPSSEIFGVLTGMKESFETNLGNSRQEENTNNKAYEDLKAAKEDELSSGKALLEKKTGELATADEKNAESKEDLEDTQESLDSDMKFLADVKAKCANMDAEFAERTKNRQLEIEAVTKALSFLTSDEAHELFTKTFNPALIQKRAQSARRDRLARTVEVAGRRAHDPRLSAIATRIRLDAFTEVKAKIQMMIDKLTQEKEEEVKKKDFCIDEFNKNSAKTEETTRTKVGLEAKIADFEQTVSDLDAAIATLKKELADLKENLKRAGEDREIANKEFQELVADQRATQKILTASLNILKGFYEKGALVQTRATTARQPAFSDFKKNENSGGVMGMMGGIIDEAKAMENEALTAEDDAQTGYESFVKDSNDSIDEKTKDLINKQEVRAKAAADLADHTVQKDAAVAQLEQLESENHDLHVDCDYLMKNYDLRTEARDEEIDALKQGIAFFEGAQFSSFLQSW